MSKRFKVFTGNNYGVQSADGEVFIDSIVSIGDADVLVDLLNDLTEENKQLKFENENLKITINARDTLIEVCEKKFRELGFIITVDDDGYVIE